jgi:hypothetical protein
MSTRLWASLAVLRTLNPAKVFFPSKFSYLLFSNPTHKKLRRGQQIGAGRLIANYLDRSLWWASQKQWVPIKSYLLHSFLEVHTVAVAFPSHRKLWTKLAYFNFSSSNCVVQDQRTTENALIPVSSPGLYLPHTSKMLLHQNWDLRTKLLLH